MLRDKISQNNLNRDKRLLYTHVYLKRIRKILIINYERKVLQKNRSYYKISIQGWRDGSVTK